MGAIGGIVDFCNSNIEFSAFNAIRRAEVLRGRGRSVAYLDSGIGMIYNSDGIFESEQPIISERRGYKLSLVIDSPFLDADAVLEAYRAYGVEFVGMLDAPFALALYDGERRMLILARDKLGKRPLFYSLEPRKVIFSSEPKGVLATKKCAIRVNSTLLSAHLTSPVGIYGAGDIYSDLSELRFGECLLFTELGISKFFYRTSAQKKISARTTYKLKDKSAVEPTFNVDESSLFSTLDDALVAFDMPQFDVHMPSLCRIFLNAGREERKIFQFKDYTKRQSIKYSYEREDRFSAFYGRIGVGVMARADTDDASFECEKSFMLNALTDEFFSIERNEMLFLRQIFGDAKLNYLLKVFDRSQKKNEDTELLVRTLGMIYQAVKWSRLRNIELLPKEKTFSLFN